MRAARRAGSQLATSAHAIMTSGPATSATGSAKLTSPRNAEPRVPLRARARGRWPAREPAGAARSEYLGTSRLRSSSCRLCDSERRAFIGSKREARRAGNQLATSAAPPRPTTVSASTVASNEPTRSSCDASTWPSPSAPATPRHQADRDELAALPQDHLADVRSARAESHAHADLVDALAHAPREHAVDADDGEHERDGGEHERQHHRRALRSERAFDSVVERARVGQRDVGIDGGDRCTDRARELARRHYSTQRQHAPRFAGAARSANRRLLRVGSRRDSPASRRARHRRSSTNDRPDRNRPAAAVRARCRSASISRRESRR